MKENIHPKYEKTTITCACGNVIETGSTKKDIRVEICSKSHPFCNCLGGTLCRLVYFTENFA